MFKVTEPAGGKAVQLNLVFCTPYPVLITWYRAGAA